MLQVPSEASFSIYTQ